MRTIDFFQIATLYQDPIIKAIFYAVIVDVLTGISKAIVYHKLNSTISTRGITKNMMLVITPAILQPVFIAMGAGNYWGVFTAFILGTVVLSISENWIALGLPFPKELSKYIDNEKINIKKQSQNPNHNIDEDKEKP